MSDGKELYNAMVGRVFDADLASQVRPFNVRLLDLHPVEKWRHVFPYGESMDMYPAPGDIDALFHDVPRKIYVPSDDIELAPETSVFRDVSMKNTRNLAASEAVTTIDGLPMVIIPPNYTKWFNFAINAFDDSRFMGVMYLPVAEAKRRDMLYDGFPAIVDKTIMGGQIVSFATHPSF